MSGRKTVVALDMWSSSDMTSGPSKPWIYEQLSREFAVEIIPLPKRRIYDYLLRLRSFDRRRRVWADNYYRNREWDAKRPVTFNTYTRAYRKLLEGIVRKPDLVFQLGGLFGPVRLPGVPYVSYHDQTVCMVESGWRDWLPADFADFRDAYIDLEKGLYGELDRIVTYSTAAKDSIVNDYGIDANTLAVIPPAAKLDFPDSARLFGNRKLQLLFVSTDFYRKGGDVALAALPDIRRSFPECRLVIAGSRVPDELLRQCEGVEYVGQLDAGTLKRLYCESKVLLHPARYDAFPNVVKEAVVCGLPVIASRSCGIPEILDHGKAGILLDGQSAEELSSRVVSLLRDTDRYRQLQFRCLAIRHRFAPETSGARFVELFRSMLEGERASVPHRQVSHVS